MEIGYKPFDALEFVRRINEYARVARLRFYESVFVRNRFESSHARRSHGDNSSAFSFRLVDFFRVLLVYHVILGVHFMMLEVVRFDGAESSQPHVELHFGEFHALGFEFVDEPQREMKPRGGRGSRTFLLAINRLITVLVLEFLVNIRRERHFAHAGKNVLENAVENKSDDSSAVVRAGNYLDFEFLVNDENNALSALFAGLYKTFPVGEILPFKEQNFNFAAMLGIRENSRRINLRGVYDQKVAGF